MREITAITEETLSVSVLGGQVVALGIRDDADEFFGGYSVLLTPEQADALADAIRAAAAKAREGGE